MARIRTIKPDFWKSEAIAALPMRARLTFIGLWSYVDDNGVGIDNEKLIAAELFPLEDDPRETLANVSRDIQTLAEHGRIVRYTVSGKRYLFVANWFEHQKIDKPGKPRYPRPEDAAPKENQELTGKPGNATEVVEESSRQSRETPSLGIGNREQGTEEQGKGEQGDLIPSAPADGSTDDPPPTVGVAPGKRPKVETPLQIACRATWHAYAEAFERRYAIRPQRDRTVNSQVKQFVEAVGAAEAPGVAAFYLESEDAFVVKAYHPFGMLLQGRVKYRTEWATGRASMTGTQAIRAERTASNPFLARALAAERREKDNQQSNQEQAHA